MTLIQISTDNTAVSALCDCVKSHSANLKSAMSAKGQHDHSIQLHDSASAEGRAVRLIVTRARGLAAETCSKLLASQAVKLEQNVAAAIRALNDGSLDDTLRSVLVNNIVVAIGDLDESKQLLAEPVSQSSIVSGVGLHHATRRALFDAYSLVGNRHSIDDYNSTLDVVQDFTSMELHSMPVQAVASMQKKLAEAIANVGVADHMVAYYRPLNAEQLAQASKKPVRFHAEAELKASRFELDNLITKIAALLPTAVSAVTQSMSVPNFRGRVIESGMIICIVADNKLKLARRLLAETESRVLVGSDYSDTDEMFTRIEDYMRGHNTAA